MNKQFLEKQWDTLTEKQKKQYFSLFLEFSFDYIDLLMKLVKLSNEFAIIDTQQLKNEATIRAVNAYELVRVVTGGTLEGDIHNLFERKTPQPRVTDKVN